MAAHGIHGDDDEVPEWLCCPISMETMSDPVLAADGMTYDRKSIAQWFKNKTTSPSTGSDLPHTRLVPNRAVKCLIDAWHATNGTCWTQTPDKQTAPADAESQYAGLSPPELPAASGATAPRLTAAQPAAGAATSSSETPSSAVAPAASSAPAEPATPDSTGHASAALLDTFTAPAPAPAPAPAAAAAAAAAGGGGGGSSTAAQEPPAPSTSQQREVVPADAVVVVRQEVSDSGIHLRCEEIRPHGDEARAYVRWMVHNKHPSYKSATVTITWKAEGQFEAYNYTLPQAPISRLVPPGAQVMVYDSDKILPDFVFGGNGAEWLYTWHLAKR